MTCYRRFIDKKKKKKHLGAAEKQDSFNASRQHSDVNERQGGECVPTCDAGSTSGSASQSPRKKLRSTMSLPIVSSGPVLPALCIICEKVEKYISVSGKRTKNPLKVGACRRFLLQCSLVLEQQLGSFSTDVNLLSGLKQENGPIHFGSKRSQPNLF